MQKGTFVIFLFILQHVLSSINILSNKFQDKSATLGEAANLINSVILSFENARSTIGFSDLWLDIKTFCDKNDVKLILPFQTQGIVYLLLTKKYLYKLILSLSLLNMFMFSI